MGFRYNLVELPFSYKLRCSVKYDIYHHILAVRSKPTLDEYLQGFKWCPSEKTPSIQRVYSHLWIKLPGNVNTQGLLNVD